MLLSIFNYEAYVCNDNLVKMKKKSVWQMWSFMAPFSDIDIVFAVINNEEILDVNSEERCVEYFGLLFK